LRKFAVASLQFAGQFVIASNLQPFDKLRAAHTLRLTPFALCLMPSRKFAVASLQFAGQFVIASNHLPFDKLRAAQTLRLTP
jgi:hypothetical protein